MSEDVKEVLSVMLDRIEDLSKQVSTQEEALAACQENDELTKLFDAQVKSFLRFNEVLRKNQNGWRRARVVIEQKSNCIDNLAKYIDELTTKNNNLAQKISELNVAHVSVESMTWQAAAACGRHIDAMRKLRAENPPLGLMSSRNTVECLIRTLDEADKEMKRSLVEDSEIPF